MTNILVLVEQRGGTLNPQSWETIVAGQKLADLSDVGLDIGLMGGDIAAVAGELADLKADRLFLISDRLLEPYRAETYCAAARVLMDELSPQLVLLPHTYLVRDFAPRLAAGCKRSLISDCIGFRHEDGRIVFVRQLFNGKINADVTTVGEGPHFVSFQTGAFRPDDLVTESGALHLQRMDVSLDAAQFTSRANAPVHATSAGVDLTRADVIVSVGRGMQAEENIELARKLAAILHGEVGASRPVCDAGWMSIDHQIGSSGQTVAPKLYLALGISGTIQHLVGAKGSDTIVAINKDANAPIFKAADYGVVGDVLEVVPALIEELQESA